MRKIWVILLLAGVTGAAMAKEPSSDSAMSAVIALQKRVLALESMAGQLQTQINNVPEGKRGIPGERVWGAMEQPTDLRTILVF